MKIQRFEGIIAWQRVKYLGGSIYTEFSGNIKILGLKIKFYDRKKLLTLK